MAKMDVIGNRFGRLVVLRRKGDERPLRYQVVCACDCGKEWSGYLYSLTTGYTKSCGCLNTELIVARSRGLKRHKDMTGLRFGRLTVIERGGLNRSRSAKWLCKCDCGNSVETTAQSLRVAGTKSCGCLQKEKAKALMTKHGRYKDADYIHELSLRREAWKRGGKNEKVEPALVYERDMGLCQLCGLPVGPDELHIDHRIPLVRGGEHSYANCQTAHASCNYKKGRKMPHECGFLWSRS